MNLRQARKIGKRQARRARGNPLLPGDQQAYNAGQLMAACRRLYRSWRRASPLVEKSRKIIYKPHADWIYGNRVASLHDRGYYIREAKPPVSAYEYGQCMGAGNRRPVEDG